MCGSSWVAQVSSQVGKGPGRESFFKKKPVIARLIAGEQTVCAPGVPKTTPQVVCGWCDGRSGSPQILQLCGGSGLLFWLPVLVETDRFHLQLFVLAASFLSCG